MVDDEQFLADAIGSALETRGYRSMIMTDGQRAIDFLNKAPARDDIAGIILDLSIPEGMGGREAIGEIRRIRPQLPVFATSGYADDPIMVNPTQHGFTASLTKPFGMKKLFSLLNTHLPDRALEVTA